MLVVPRSVIGMCVAGMLLLGGCSDSGSKKADLTTSTDSTATKATTPGVSSAVAADQRTRYELLDSSGWELRTGLDYRAGLGALDKAEPDLDWSASYDGPRVDGADGSYTIPRVRVSAHFSDLEGRRKHLAGFELAPGTVNGRTALVGQGGGGTPRVVLLELAPDYSLMLLTYDDPVDLEKLAAALAPADEKGWIAAGGKVLDCVPGESNCGFDK